MQVKCLTDRALAPQQRVVARVTSVTAMHGEAAVTPVVRGEEEDGVGPHARIFQLGRQVCHPIVKHVERRDIVCVTFAAPGFPRGWLPSRPCVHRLVNRHSIL